MVAVGAIAEMAFLWALKADNTRFGVVASSTATALFLFPLWRVVWIAVAVTRAEETFLKNNG